MPVSHVLDDRCINFSCVATTPFHEGVAAYLGGLREAAEVGEGWDVLIDLRRCTQLLGEEELDGLAQMFQAQTELLNGRIALVIAGPRYYSVGKMFQHLAEDRGLETGVFDDPEEARSWLASPKLVG